MAGTFGQGAVLTYTTDSKVIADITSVGSPTLSRDSIDVTTHDSADGFREFIGGLKDGGEVAIEGVYVPTDDGQAQLITHLKSDTADGVAALTLVLADDSDWAFNAICTAYENASPHDDALGFSATLKVTGNPVFSAT